MVSRIYVVYVILRLEIDMFTLTHCATYGSMVDSETMDIINVGSLFIGECWIYLDGKNCAIVSFEYLCFSTENIFIIKFLYSSRLGL